MIVRLFVAGLVAVAGYLAYVIAVALGAESLFTAGPRIAADPWTWVTIVDLYLGFFVFSGFIVIRERLRWRAVVWLAAIFCLGNLACAAYLAWALHRGGYDAATLLKRA
jgi:hypothetical protein